MSHLLWEICSLSFPKVLRIIQIKSCTIRISINHGISNQKICLIMLKSPRYRYICRNSFHCYVIFTRQILKKITQNWSCLPQLQIYVWNSVNGYGRNNRHFDNLEIFTKYKFNFNSSIYIAATATRIYRGTSRYRGKYHKKNCQASFSG